MVLLLYYQVIKLISQKMPRFGSQLGIEGKVNQPWSCSENPLKNHPLELLRNHQLEVWQQNSPGVRNSRSRRQRLHLQKSQHQGMVYN